MVVKILPYYSISIREPSNSEILFQYLTSEEIPEWALAKIQEMEAIRISNRNISFIPKWFGRLHNLKTLIIVSCFNLRILPDIFNDTTSIETLGIIETPIEYLPQSMENLYNLKNMGIIATHINFTTFNFSKLSLIEMLHFENIHNFVLTDSVGTLENLRYLFIRDCYNVASVPSWISHLKKLEILEIKHSGLLSVTNSISNLTLLRELTLDDNTALSNMPHDMNLPQSLKFISLKNTNITDLPPSVSNLNLLEGIHMGGCIHLNEIPHFLKFSTSIRTMYFYDTNISSIPDWIWGIHSLRRLVVSGSPVSEKLHILE